MFALHARALVLVLGGVGALGALRSGGCGGGSWGCGRWRNGNGRVRADGSGRETLARARALGQPRTLGPQAQGPRLWEAPSPAPSRTPTRAASPRSPRRGPRAPHRRKNPPPVPGRRRRMQGHRRERLDPGAAVGAELDAILELRAASRAIHGDLPVRSMSRFACRPAERNLTAGQLVAQQITASPAAAGGPHRVRTVKM